MLDKNPNSDCRTKKLIKFKVDDQVSLLRLEGLFYKTKLTSPFLKVVKYTDTHLIGKTIYLRTPATCNGDKICQVCYGELSHINNDINIGVLGATTMSSRFTQNILSSKHSLMTRSQKIELNDGYEKYFILDSNQVLLDVNNIGNTNQL